jgi:succinate dehydrogenase / fumarate reductase cytochrome b subunit
MSSAKIVSISSAFIWRRVHSLMGFWLVIYITQHLIINSQLALWLGADGIGFIRSVNLLESLPYLQVIETVLIGFPLLFHTIWGIQRALQPKYNSGKSNYTKPSLPFERNKAFTWQRLSSWILLVGILGHVAQMRFLNYPHEIKSGNETLYQVTITQDPGLITLSQRLNVSLCNVDKIHTVATAPTPGAAMLLMVRDTFKSPLMMILYSIFVLAAAFHACNGLWTFLITWGLILSYRAQKSLIPFSVLGVALLSFLGFAAIWGSYLINLKR